MDENALIDDLLLGRASRAPRIHQVTPRAACDHTTFDSRPQTSLASSLRSRTPANAAQMHSWKVFGANARFDDVLRLSTIHASTI
jgi:hypothetical protein